MKYFFAVRIRASPVALRRSLRCTDVVECEECDGSRTNIDVVAENLKKTLF